MNGYLPPADGHAHRRHQPPRGLSVREVVRVGHALLTPAPPQTPTAQRVLSLAQNHEERTFPRRSRRRVDGWHCWRERADVTLLVRPARPEDAAALAALAGHAFRATYEGLVDNRTIQAVVEQTCTPAAFVELAASGTPDQLLVADEDGLLQGFLDFAQEPNGLELRRLYARAGQTSRGVGAALLAFLEDALPDSTTYRIVVVKANVRGLAFWERHGFRSQDEVDGVQHFAAHRNVRFQPGADPVKLLVMRRTVAHDDR